MGNAFETPKDKRIGNQFWKLALFPGRTTEYKPLELAERADQYFCYCDEHPWWKKELVKGGENAGMIIDIPVQCPYIMSGLCLFLGISQQTFLNYEKRKEFFEVCTRIREIIYTQKFSGASVGAFNAAIIARDLGLVDKREVNNPNEMPLTREQMLAKLEKLRKNKRKDE